jgi:hypothetical protein
MNRNKIYITNKRNKERMWWHSIKWIKRGCYEYHNNNSWITGEMEEYLKTQYAQLKIKKQKISITLNLKKITCN